MFLKKIENKTELDVQLANDPQYRRELSISYFNSLNNAVNLVTTGTPKTMKLEAKIDLIMQVRNHFLEEYKQYRIDVLENRGGKNVITPELVPALDKAKKKYENI